MIVFTVIFSAAALCHGLGAWNSYRFYRNNDAAYDSLAARWLKVGLVLQLWALLGKWLVDGSASLATPAGIVTLLSLSLGLALLSGRSKVSVPVLTSFFLPLIFFLALLAFVVLGKVPVGDGRWMTTGMALHIFLTFLGFGHFTLGFGVGMAFWIQEGQLKQHRLKSWSYRLPALEILDNLTVFYTGAGFLLWSGGFLLGVFQALQVWGHLPFSDPKILGALLVLVIYALFFLLRWGFRMRGRKTMVLVMAGYFLALFTFVGVRVFLTTQHVF